jgi:hypothetical protein
VTKTRARFTSRLPKGEILDDRLGSTSSNGDAAGDD